MHCSSSVPCWPASAKCVLENWGAYKTIGATKRQQLLNHPIWKFQNGRYVATRDNYIHDIEWATDQLMTAVRLGEGRAVRAMIPDARRRLVLVKRIRLALRHKATELSDYSPRGTVKLVSPWDSDYSIVLRWSLTRSGWALRDARNENRGGE